MGYRVCSTPGCPTLHPGKGRCPECRAAADTKRRPEGNPYRTAGHRILFREEVLLRNPYCVVCKVAWSTVADHYPIERRDLVELGLDPNDPARGRGLCKPCHDKHTAHTSPGGWNARD